jgi:hypothetical protein
MFSPLRFKNEHTKVLMFLCIQVGTYTQALAYTPTCTLAHSQMCVPTLMLSHILAILDLCLRDSDWHDWSRAWVLLLLLFNGTHTHIHTPQNHEHKFIVDTASNQDYKHHYTSFTDVFENWLTRKHSTGWVTERKLQKEIWFWGWQIPRSPLDCMCDEIFGELSSYW